MKKFKIFTGLHGRPSTKLIFSKITNPDSEHLVKSTKLNSFVSRKDPKNLKNRQILKGFETPNAKGAIVVRWGCYYNLDTDGHTIVYNKAEAIKLVNDKGQCRKFLAEKGIDVPKTYLLNEISSMLANNQVVYPLVGRPSHHGRGSHFHVCNNSAELRNAIQQGCTYFSLIYPKTEEYGVHCALGKCLAVMKKPAPKDGKVAWNRALNDEPFTVVPQADYKNYICKLALRACKEVGLDFARTLAN